MIDETRSAIRAVRRAIGLMEALIDAWAEVADELSAIQDEIAEEAYLRMRLRRSHRYGGG